MGGHSSQGGYEIKPPTLDFKSIFSVDQHQLRMIFPQCTQKQNLGSPGPGLTFENADTSQISPKSNLPCICLHVAVLDMVLEMVTLSCFSRGLPGSGGYQQCPPTCSTSILWKVPWIGFTPTFDWLSLAHSLTFEWFPSPLPSGF